MRIDLSTLEYPRHLHRADGASQIVATVADAQRAVQDGWTVGYRAPDDPTPLHETYTQEPEPASTPKTTKHKGVAP